jgi:hypothetical protein
MVERLRFSRADRLNQLGANAMSNIKYSIDPNLPNETLLSEMQTAAKLAASDNNGERFLGAVITPFSAILVQLAVDAERTARKLIILTKILIILTGLIIILTILIVVFESVKFYREIIQTPINFPQDGNTGDQTNQNTNTRDKLDDDHPRRNN